MRFCNCTIVMPREGKKKSETQLFTTLNFTFGNRRTTDTNCKLIFSVKFSTPKEIRKQIFSMHNLKCFCRWKMFIFMYFFCVMMMLSNWMSMPSLHCIWTIFDGSLIWHMNFAFDFPITRVPAVQAFICRYTIKYGIFRLISAFMRGISVLDFGKIH